MERLTHNLQNFKENKYKRIHTDIDYTAFTQKYETKLLKLDKEIDKLEQIIKNGCGKIVEKPLTSRVSLNSTIQLGSESRRSLEESIASKNYIQF